MTTRHHFKPAYEGSKICGHQARGMKRGFYQSCSKFEDDAEHFQPRPSAVNIDTSPESQSAADILDELARETERFIARTT